MRKRTGKYLINYEKAYRNLENALQVAVTELEIDGVIKRFELCYELAWKLIKEHLADLGIVCNSPRECFKHAVNNSLIQNMEDWMKMIEDRNRLVHTYTFEESREIYENIKNSHAESFRYLHGKIREAGS